MPDILLMSVHLDAHGKQFEADDPDWQTIEQHCDQRSLDDDGHAPTSKCEFDAQATLQRIGRILDWIAAGARDSERSIRLAAVRGILSGKTQADMAITLGVTKAAVSRLANEFARDFAFPDQVRITAHMRSTEVQVQFSHECKLRHQIRIAAA